MKERIGDMPKPEDIHAIHTGQADGRPVATVKDIEARAEAATLEKIARIQADWAKATIIGGKKEYEWLVRQGVPYLLAQLKAKEEALAAVGGVTHDLDNLVQRFKDEDWSRVEIAEAVWAWVRRLDRILKGGA